MRHTVYSACISFQMALNCSNIIYRTLYFSWKSIQFSFLFCRLCNLIWFVLVSPYMCVQLYNSSSVWSVSACAYIFDRLSLSNAIFCHYVHLHHLLLQISKMRFEFHDERYKTRHLIRTPHNTQYKCESCWNTSHILTSFGRNDFCHFACSQIHQFFSSTTFHLAFHIAVCRLTFTHSINADGRRDSYQSEWFVVLILLLLLPLYSI